MDKALELDFGQQVAKTEYKRVMAVSIFLGLGFMVQLINILLNPNIASKFKSDFLSKGIYSNLGVLAFEVIMLLIIKSYAKEGKILPKRFVWGYTYFEAIFPSILIYSACSWDNNAVHLDSPLFLLYFIFIILSTLHLERAYSILTGLVSGIGYILVVYSVQINDEILIRTVDHEYLFYYIKGLTLIASGILAGMVTALIKKQFQQNLEITREKAKIQRIFGQQVSKEVVEKLIDGNAHKDMVTEEVEASIMFMDIRNFSAFTENKNPKEIIEFQNTVFSPLIEIIDKHNGIINQILGDGFMATFGTPINNEEHIQDAFNAGCEIIQKMKELSNEGIIHESNIGIGLAVGTVVTGNIGNSIRKQFSVAGRTVILASRLEQLNKEFGSSFLISENVMNALSSGIKGEHLGKIAVKGFEEKIDVYKIR